MDTDGFREFLTKRELPPEQIEIGVATASRFAAYVGEHPGLDSRSLVLGFAEQLIAAGDNDWDHLAAVARFGGFSGDDAVYLTAVDLVDGAEALGNLHTRIGEELGTEIQEQIFAGIGLPPTGTAATGRHRTTALVMERMESLLDEETCGRLLDPCLRDLPEEWHLPERDKYLAADGFDGYLQAKGDEFLEYLEGLAESGEPYFTQKITPEVVEFVRSQPEISHGVRDRSILYETKIPYDTIGYLAAETDAERRYRYCHCPWARESLDDNEVEVSPTFCRCSSGFHKRQWEVILGRPLRAEVLESVLAGDDRCRFAIHLPLEVLGREA